MVKKLIDLEDGGVISLTNICYISPEAHGIRVVRTEDGEDINISATDFDSIRAQFEARNGFFHFSIGLILLIGIGSLFFVEPEQPKTVATAEYRCVVVESTATDIIELEE